MNRKRERQMDSREIESPSKVQKTSEDQNVKIKQAELIIADINKSLTSIKEKFQELSNNLNKIRTLAVDFIGKDFKQSPQYQVYRDEFINYDPHCLDEILPDHVKKDLRNKFPDLNTSGSIILSPDDLDVAWEYLWSQLDQPTKLRIAFSNDDDNELVSLLNTMEDTFAETVHELSMSIPFSVKIALLSNFSADIIQIKDEMKDLLEIKKALESEGERLEQSLSFIRDSTYSKNMELSNLQEIQMNFDKEKAKVMTQLKEKTEIIEAFQDMTMNLPNLRKKEDVPLCSICCEERKTHALPCGHIFCLTCVHGIDNNQGYRGAQCPDCRKNFSIDQLLRVFC